LYNFARLRYRSPRFAPMQPTPIKIRIVGPGRAVPRRLSNLLTSAGYEISRARLPAGGKRGAKRRGAVVVEVAPPDGRTAGRGDEPRPPAMTLRALRESVGRTQGEVATRVAMTQPQLSRVEARRDHLISTLRKYVRALDGQIEVAAIVNGSRYVLRDV